MKEEVWKGLCRYLKNKLVASVAYERCFAGLISSWWYVGKVWRKILEYCVSDNFQFVKVLVMEVFDRVNIWKGQPFAKFI